MDLSHDVDQAIAIGVCSPARLSSEQALTSCPTTRTTRYAASRRRTASGVSMADKRWWAFDRPVLHDPLFLLALAAGVLVLCIATYRLATSALPWGVWFWEGIGGAVGTWFTAGVLFGTARNLLRGYRGPSERHQSADR